MPCLNKQHRHKQRVNRLVLVNRLPFFVRPVGGCWTARRRVAARRQALQIASQAVAPPKHVCRYDCLVPPAQGSVDRSRRRQALLDSHELSLQTLPCRGGWGRGSANHRPSRGGGWSFHFPLVVPSFPRPLLERLITRQSPELHSTRPQIIDQTRPTCFASTSQNKKKPTLTQNTHTT